MPWPSQGQASREGAWLLPGTPAPGVASPGPVPQSPLLSPPLCCRAAISRDPFYEMLAARKKKVSSAKRH